MCKSKHFSGLVKWENGWTGFITIRCLFFCSISKPLVVVVVNWDLNLGDDSLVPHITGFTPSKAQGTLVPIFRIHGIHI